MGRWNTAGELQARLGRGLLLVAVSLVLAGCGGRTRQSPSLAGPLTESHQAVALQSLPEPDELDRLPLAHDKAPSARSGSGIRPSDFHGVYATAQSAHASPEQQFYLNLPAPQGSPEFAIYATESLDEVVRLARVTLTLAPQSAQCAVAWSDYQHGRWSMLTRAADGSFAPAAGPAACVSPAGRAYVAVLAWPTALTIKFVDIDFDDGGQLPAPQGLSVAPSSSGLHVSWQPYVDPRHGHFQLRVSGPDYARDVWRAREETSGEVSGMRAGETYTVELRAVDVAEQPGRAITQQITLPAGWTHTWTAYSGGNLTALLPQTNGGVLAVGNTATELIGGGTVLSYGAAGELSGSRFWPGATFNGASPVPGGYVIYGSLPGSGDEVKALLLRLSGNGAVLWARTWSAGDHNLPIGAASDTAGNIYVDVSPVIAYNDPQAGYVCKYSPAGDLVWSRRWPATTRTQLMSLALADDGVYLGGWLHTAYNPSEMESDGPHRQALLLKVNGNGELARADAWLASRWMDLWWSALAPDGAGGCLAGGVLMDDPYQMLYMGGPRFSDAVAASIDASGSVRWASGYTASLQDGSSFAGFTGLMADGAGGCYSVGYQTGQPLPSGQLLCHFDGLGTLASGECFLGNSSAVSFNCGGLTATQLYIGGEAQSSGGGWAAAAGEAHPLALEHSTPAGQLVSLGATSTDVTAQMQGKLIVGKQDIALPGPTATAHQTWLLSRPR